MSRTALTIRQSTPPDEAFRNAFEYYKMPSRRSSKKIRFLLADIETSLGQPVNYLETTLEHVCPYHPDQHWDQYFGEGANDISDRLGNMVLLQQNELGRIDFATKKSRYQDTPFTLARKVAEYGDWDLPNLNSYQSWLADQAVRVWRVD